MNKIFCSDCGHKNLYEVTQPKFCAGCGCGIGVGVSKASDPVVEESFKQEAVSDGVLGDIDLNKLRRQIVAETSSNKIKLGDIMGSSASSYEDEFVRDASNLPDGEELLQMNKKDCGSSRSSDVDG